MQPAPKCGTGWLNGKDSARRRLRGTKRGWLRLRLLVEVSWGYMRRVSWLLWAASAVLFGQNIKTGPAVGSPTPDFSALDQAGRTQTLKSIMGPKGAMLVFYRSADW